MSGRFLYLECPDCQWSCIVPAALAKAELLCTLCAGDSGHEVVLQGREAVASDKAEGCDARQEPWA